MSRCGLGGRRLFIAAVGNDASNACALGFRLVVVMGVRGGVKGAEEKKQRREDSSERPGAHRLLTRRNIAIVKLRRGHSGTLTQPAATEKLFRHPPARW